MTERPPDEAFDGVNAVVHLAGEPISQRWSDSAKQRIMDSRRKGTGNLVAGIKTLENRPEVMVSGSAIGYYGNTGGEPLDETAGQGDDFAAEVVGEWEKAALGVETAGVRLVILRTGLVLDRSGGLLGQLLTPFKLGAGGQIGNGRQYMSWVHAEDEVRLILWAIDDPKVRGRINATAPEPVTNHDFSKALGRALHRPAVIPTPVFALKIIFGEFAGSITGGQRVIPRAALDQGFEFRHTDLDEALQDVLAD